MSYSRELWENTRLTDKTYPINLFLNRKPQVVAGQNILFLHWHEHFEWIVMQQGSAVFHIDSIQYEAHAGDVLIVPAGGLHVGYSLSEQPVEFVSIVFNAALLAGAAHDPLYAQYVQPFVEGRCRFPVKPALDELSLAPVKNLLQLMIGEFEAKRPALQLALKSYAALIFSLLARECLPVSLTSHSPERFIYNRERFKLLIERLQTQPAAKLTVEEAARTVNLSPFHFCKTFKKLTGRTYVDYANLCRMLEAERLLRTTDGTVTEIAASVGCDNPNYFTKLFRQYIGLTPREVRRQR